ncbi:integrase [Hyphomonas pacifica]|jgi:integrase|nr:integrase [Hyphomonas pacifica]
MPGKDAALLTDVAIRALKPKDKLYKVGDRDGMYVTVSTVGTVTFRMDYRIHGRRETLTIGRYGHGGISLSEARHRCMDAKRLIESGISPAKEKKRSKTRLMESGSFSEMANRWIESDDMAESTRDMRRHILNRDILPAFGSYLLSEVTPEDLRALCEKVKKRGAPSTALHVREFVHLIYKYARLHGVKVDNPADEVAPVSIAKVRPRDRALSPLEIRIFYSVLEELIATPTLKLGLKFVLLTMKRKSEVSLATWDEISFENAVWSIPKERMKTGLPHNVYLSRQALDILVALKTCAGGSRYVFPSRYDCYKPISNATLNRLTTAAWETAQEAGLPLERFTVHDLRRTGSTLLNELGFNRDWVEKCLAHEDRRTSRGVYNKAEYADGRRHMMQEWADTIDAWSAGLQRQPVLTPPASADLGFDLELDPKFGN